MAVSGYSAVFLLIIAAVAIGYQPPRQTAASLANITNVADDAASAAPSVDQVVATNIAADLAAQTSLPVAANLANTSVSLIAQSQLDQSSADTISKPQIVQPKTTGNSLITYKAVRGDTVSEVAAKHNVSPQTIRWANDLVSDALKPGQKVMIPPVDGVVHRVKSGDTPKSIASKYNANKAVVIAYNDLEGLDSLPRNRQIVIPGGHLPQNMQPGYEAPNRTGQIGGGNGYGSGLGTSRSPVDAGMASASAGNQYAFGNCTWYAFNRRAQLGMPIGSYWGNASTWASYARAAGFTVNSSPAAGAIMQNSGGYGGYGHVSIVEQVVRGDYVRISEMNAYRGGGGFNRVSYYDMPWSEAVSGGYDYIH